MSQLLTSHALRTPSILLALPLPSRVDRRDLLAPVFVQICRQRPPRFTEDEAFVQHDCHRNNPREFLCHSTLHKLLGDVQEVTPMMGSVNMMVRQRRAWGDSFELIVGEWFSAVCCCTTRARLSARTGGV